MQLFGRSNPFDVGLFFFGWKLGFDVHIAEFARFEDLAAFKALYKLRIFVARNDLDSGMPALVVHYVALGKVEGCLCWLAEIHRDPLRVKTPRLSGILAVANRLSSISNVKFGQRNQNLQWPKAGRDGSKV